MLHDTVSAILRVNVSIHCFRLLHLKEFICVKMYKNKNACAAVFSLLPLKIQKSCFVSVVTAFPSALIAWFSLLCNKYVTRTKSRFQQCCVFCSDERQLHISSS